MKKRLLKKILAVFLIVVVNALIVFILLEIVLRIFPTLIPIDILYNFQNKTRVEIAQRRHLTTRDDFVFFKTDGDLEIRVFKPFTKLTYEANDPGIVTTVVMDEMGFCNPQSSYNSTIIDLITIGDSVTWCQNVNPDDTWTSKLAQLTGLHTYNLGLPGIGLYEYLEILKKFGIQKSPQTVIMGFAAGNDLRDALNYRSKQKDSLTLIQKNIFNSLGSSLMGQNSYAFNLVLATVRRIYQISYRKKEIPESEINFRFGIKLSDEIIRFNPENMDRDEVLYAKQLFKHELDLEVFTPALTTYVDLSIMHGFVPIVAYIPSVYAVYADRVIFDDSALNDLMPWYSSELRSFLKKKEKDVGYVFIDLTSYLQKAASLSSPSQLFYYQSNLHLTAHGHMVIAETLNKLLKEMNIIIPRKN